MTAKSVAIVIIVSFMPAALISASAGAVIDSVCPKRTAEVIPMKLKSLPRMKGLIVRDTESAQAEAGAEAAYIQQLNKLGLDSMRPWEVTRLNEVKKMMDESAGGPLVDYQQRAMHIPDSLLVYAFNTYAKENPARLVQGILWGDPALIEYVNIGANGANGAKKAGEKTEPEKVARPAVFQVDEALLRPLNLKDPSLYKVDEVIPLPPVDGDQLPRENRIALFSYFLRHGQEVEIQSVEYGAKNQYVQAVKSGKVAYIIGSQSGRHFYIGFKSVAADGAISYFQIPWGNIYFLRVKGTERPVVDLNSEFKTAMMGNSYERPSIKNSEDLTPEQFRNYVTQNIPEAEAVLSRLLKIDERSDLKHYGCLEFFRGIQLAVAYDLVKKSVKGDEDAATFELLRLLVTKNKRLANAVDNALPDFPTELRARFP